MATSTSEKRLGDVKRTPTTICEFEWNIQDFLSLSRTLHGGPSFSFAGVHWALCIKIDNDTASNSIGYIHLVLGRKSCISCINPQVSFSFKTSDGNEDRRCDALRLSKGGFEMYTASPCLSREELLNRKSELLPSDALTVLCTFKYSKSTNDANVLCTSASSDVFRENKLFHDFKDFFLKKENCDVTMRVQGQEFPAHKAILEARSPVLASTFRSDMKEKATGIMDIEDCDPFYFSDFLCFLYCGDTDVISKENVFSLFTVADKYDVQDLREMCAEFMKKNLSVDTFCETISLALRHSEVQLIKLTTDFFIQNAKEITLTVKWQTFLAEHTIAGNELIVKFIASK